MSIFSASQHSAAAMSWWSTMSANCIISRNVDDQRGDDGDWLCCCALWQADVDEQCVRIVSPFVWCHVWRERQLVWFFCSDLSFLQLVRQLPLPVKSQKLVGLTPQHPAMSWWSTMSANCIISRNVDDQRGDDGDWLCCCVLWQADVDEQCVRNVSPFVYSSRSTPRACIIWHWNRKALNCRK